MSDATTTVTAVGSYVVDFDNDNDETDRYASWGHNNGVELMRLGEDGRLGIGTTIPFSLLHLEGGSAGIHVMRSGGNAYIKLGEPGSTSIGGAIYAVDGAGGLRFFSFNSGTEWARFDASGYLGVGNASPTELFVVGPGADASDVSQTLAMVTGTGATNLAVRDSANNVEAMVFVDSGGAHFGTYTNQPVFFDANNATKMYIGTDGKVGIGVTAPGGKLHVGAGFDTPSLSSPTLYVTESGQVKAAFRDGTNDIELGVIVGTSMAQLGTITNHDLQILANNTEKARLTAAGNLGIGTTSPAVALDVQRDGASAGALVAAYGTGNVASMALYSARGTQASPTVMMSGDVIGEVLFQGRSTGRQTGARIQAKAGANWDNVVPDAATDILFSTAPMGSGTLADRMIIKAGGQVGIGTTAPSVRLEVATDGGGNVIASAAYGTGAQASLNLMTARGTLASPTATQNADYLGEIIFQGWDTDRTTGAKIYALAAAAWGSASDSTDAPAELRFATVPDGSQTLADRLTIKSDGKVGIGTITPATNFEVLSDGIDNVIQSSAYGTGFIPYLNLSGARGTAASPTATQSGDVIGVVNFQGYGVGRANGAQIYAQAAAEWGTSGDTTDSPTDLVFATTPDGSGTPAECMILRSTRVVEIPSQMRILDGENNTFGGYPSLGIKGDYPVILYLDDGTINTTIQQAEGYLNWQLSGDERQYIFGFDSNYGDVKMWFQNDETRLGVGLHGIGQPYPPQGGIHAHHSVTSSGAKWLFKNFLASSTPTPVFTNDGGFDAGGICNHYCFVIMSYQPFGGSPPDPGYAMFGVATGGNHVVGITGSDEITFSIDETDKELVAEVTAGDSVYRCAMTCLFL